jgi:hypothetical protein
MWEKVVYLSYQLGRLQSAIGPEKLIKALCKLVNDEPHGVKYPIYHIYISGPLESRQTTNSSQLASKELR